jgi:predicted  nucleic acid-binding Zn-ribbon protein
MVSQKVNRVAAPSIQISWGELIDKITILEIKEQRLLSKQSVANVRSELATLTSVADCMLAKRKDVAALKKQLKSINETLWEIEDKIRAKEAAQSFDQEFIQLARSVYMNNDKRGDLKRRINVLLNSTLGEEKQYTSYSG